jgi:DNA invertase Pin-like site-specific DNA recombinase
MARIGYARVSTADQDLEVQLDRLRAEGCGLVRAEKVSGASRDGRPELATIIAFLRPADELVVTRLDRLGHPKSLPSRGRFLAPTARLGSAYDIEWDRVR